MSSNASKNTTNVAQPQARSEGTYAPLTGAPMTSPSTTPHPVAAPKTSPTTTPQPVTAPMSSPTTTPHPLAVPTDSPAPSPVPASAPVTRPKGSGDSHSLRQQAAVQVEDFHTSTAAPVLVSVTPVAVATQNTPLTTLEPAHVSRVTVLRPKERVSWSFLVGAWLVAILVCALVVWHRNREQAHHTKTQAAWHPQVV
eukprot:TRINITY_DN20645_c0_g1_i1.p1 TRINITY_DN20645_c0_g1~~TRINITY_DN20645_c0_g1_i1.p1  ORF type:complete len:197 (+),score=17.09 TRINITY_DN20645_c0_g1_i1:263-853(+)